MGFTLLGIMQQQAAGGDTFNLYLLGGGSGTLRSSEDGENWTARSAGFSTGPGNRVQGIGYHDNFYVAVAGTTQELKWSEDGISWNNGSIVNSALGTGGERELIVVAYGEGSGGLWVMGGRTDNFGTRLGRVLTSPDGKNWTLRSTDLGAVRVTGAVYGNNLYVVCGSDGADRRVNTSSDGITWTSRSLPSVDVQSIGNVAFGNNRYFIAMNNQFYTSTNGTSWGTQNSPMSNPPTGKGNFAVAFGNNLFVAVGGIFNGAGSLQTSTGGAFTERTIPAVGFLRTAFFANNLYLAAGKNGNLITSPDGITWTSRTSGTSAEIFALGGG